MVPEAGDFDFLALPGRGNSGPDHWMSHWCRAFPNSSRVLQAEWDRPDPRHWIARVDAAIAAAPRRVVILAHSLSVATTVKWAAEADEDRVDKVAAAFLVAPTNIEDPDPSFDLVRPFAPMPLAPLPFPALVVASRTDPRVTFSKAHEFASAWECAVADAGELGHMGNEAKLGVWPEGLLMLGRLLEQARL
ncbi:alpha/beta hydrolase [Mesorhizobium sp. Root554]|uniref:RBBP9/YdeN family alpha/beta hydrolase n=1 Tax=unclassified Mesorhizobium TaxID=325217 RepID=UPI0006F787EA|nr:MULTISPECIES: alpha/beta hydrolase [unclassified Mesorhizobium]KQZ13136.1 alpha/beta hydrolase [Mesorhizobium sp. Root1471]KQZ35651.1 alpha/beta hydrolase [Mesorhizobium sp. Root554]